MFDGRSCRCDPGYTQTGVGNDRSCVAIPACIGPDDAYEDNDDPDNAAAISSGSSQQYGCPADADWYVIPLEAGDELSVLIEFDGSAVDLDLFLFGPDSSGPLDFSTGTGNEESARIVTRQAGTGGILVNPYGTGQGGYSMAVSVQGGEVPECSAPGGPCGVNGDCCSNSCHLGHCH